MLSAFRSRHAARGRINPYIEAGSIVAQRMLWDLNPKSWASRARLSKWRNHYVGEKAVILCNGPSLNSVNFDSLGNVFTFGLNKINLLFDKTSFRPSCIVSVNKLVIQQNRDFLEETNIPLFIDSTSADTVPFRSNVIFLHSTADRANVASDCSVSIVQGFSVTVVALQLALHMGFSEVALVGCDHNFATKGPPNKVVSSTESDPNHFDEKYFAGGVPWQLPDLVASEFYYSRAALAFDYRGRKIVNCTEGGSLEIFERQHLSDFLAC